MSPDFIGVLAGLAFIAPAILLIRKRGYDAWAWPLILASLPLYYMLFGALAGSAELMALELLYGLPFVLIGLLLYRWTFRLALPLLALGWLSHGLYDYFHDVFFVNPGVFSWYPAFCAVIDIVVSAYLLWYWRVAETNTNTA